MNFISMDTGMKTIVALIAAFSFLTGCTPEMIEPELYGSIEGVVINSTDNTGLSDTSIETTPATEAILTDNKGNFQLNNVPTGSYQIRASRPDFKSKTVSITVRENRTTSAKLLIEPDEEEESSAQNLQAQITSWRQTGQTDSSHVDVEYRITNTSGTKAISSFEVYFDIYTDKDTFYYEIANSELESGEQNIGSFKKFVRNSSVDSVIISGVWVKE